MKTCTRKSLCFKTKVCLLQTWHVHVTCSLFRLDLWTLLDRESPPGNHCSTITLHSNSGFLLGQRSRVENNNCKVRNWGRKSCSLHGMEIGSKMWCQHEYCWSKEKWQRLWLCARWQSVTHSHAVKEGPPLFRVATSPMPVCLSKSFS